VRYTFGSAGDHWNTKRDPRAGVRAKSYWEPQIEDQSRCLFWEQILEEHLDSRWTSKQELEHPNSDHSKSKRDVGCVGENLDNA
jgi:hypothetical protein